MLWSTYNKKLNTDSYEKTGPSTNNFDTISLGNLKIFDPNYTGNTEAAKYIENYEFSSPSEEKVKSVIGPDLPFVFPDAKKRPIDKEHTEENEPPSKKSYNKNDDYRLIESVDSTTPPSDAHAIDMKNLNKILGDDKNFEEFYNTGLVPMEEIIANPFLEEECNKADSHILNGKKKPTDRDKEFLRPAFDEENSNSEITDLGRSPLIDNREHLETPEIRKLLSSITDKTSGTHNIEVATEVAKLCNDPINGETIQRGILAFCKKNSTHSRLIALFNNNYQKGTKAARIIINSFNNNSKKLLCGQITKLLDEFKPKIENSSYCKMYYTRLQRTLKKLDISSQKSSEENDHPSKKLCDNNEDYSLIKSGDSTTPPSNTKAIDIKNLNGILEDDIVNTNKTGPEEGGAANNDKEHLETSEIHELLSSITKQNDNNIEIAKELAKLCNDQINGETNQRKILAICKENTTYSRLIALFSSHHRKGPEAARIIIDSFNNNSKKLLREQITKFLDAFEDKLKNSRYCQNHCKNLRKILEELDISSQKSSEENSTPEVQNVIGRKHSLDEEHTKKNKPTSKKLCDNNEDYSKTEDMSCNTQKLAPIEIDIEPLGQDSDCHLHIMEVC